MLIGLEATGVLWEPHYEAATKAGYHIIVRNPHQTTSWSASLGICAKTDSIDARALACWQLEGYARGIILPSETLQASRAAPFRA